MPNIKSAKKRVKVIAVKTERNKAARTALRTAVKKAEIALQSGSDDKAQVVGEAVKKIDHAAAKGILHKNCAARKKSRLALRLNQAGQA